MLSNYTIRHTIYSSKRPDFIDVVFFRDKNLISHVGYSSGFFIRICCKNSVGFWRIKYKL